MVKLNVPPVVGIPEITPVEEFKDKPVGREPEVIDQVYGVVPPEACKVWEYAEPPVPEGKDEVMILKLIRSEYQVAGRSI
jgi:hypothetical protein